MSINGLPFDVVSTSDKQGYNNVISNPNGIETALEDFGNTPSDCHRRLASGRLHTALDALSETSAQSGPHRAWEEGYQSPFSRTFQHLSGPVHNDAQSWQFQSRTGSPSISSREAKIQDFSTAASETPIQPVLQLPSALSASPIPTINTSTNLQNSATTSKPTRQRSTAYQPRMRRIITKEMMLEDIDISALVTLGMSPFMVGQDMIANQNRFVRNECIFTRHFLRLQHATGDSDARHANTEQDIYERLEQHKLVLDKLAGGSTSVTNNTDNHSVHADSDFLALEEAHQETRTMLELLSRQVAESSESTQRALMDLAHRLDQVLAGNRAPNS